MLPQITEESRSIAMLDIVADYFCCKRRACFSIIYCYITFYRFDRYFHHELNDDIYRR